MKSFLLGEFKLTAMKYKARFDKASKRFDETHVLFALACIMNFIIT